GHRANVQRFRADARDTIPEVTEAHERIETATRLADALAAEARAASVYWSALADLPLRFGGRSAATEVPERWLTLSERHSPLSGSPRLAVTPGQALANLGYGLAEFASSLALTAMGLDIGMGWTHRDAAYRDSA